MKLKIALPVLIIQLSQLQHNKVISNHMSGDENWQLMQGAFYS